MRTLLISDLHLGSRSERDVLRRPGVLALLLAALDDVDRLVLLGDTVELQERRNDAALAVAEPVLRAIGARMGARGEIVVVAGNHDRHLVRPWLRERRGPAGLDDRVPADASPILAEVASWLTPATVTVRYPGLWVSRRVWATHGHYLDEHLVPPGAFGVPRARLGVTATGGARPADYERHRHDRGHAGRRRFDPADGADRVLLALRSARLWRARLPIGYHLAPLTSRLLDAQMRRAALPAAGRVAERLGVEADWVLFGHVHRGGPQPHDRAGQWRSSAAGPRLANTGSWVFEPLLVHGAGPGHPYWPGTALRVVDDGDPELVSLLPAAALTGPR